MGRLISDSRTTKRKLDKSTSWYSEQKKRGAFQSNRAADPFSFFASSYGGRIVHSGRYDAFLSRNNNLPTIRRRRGRQFAEASLRMSIESRNVHSQVPGIPPKKKSRLEIAAESENDPEAIKLLNQLKEYERERRHETDGIYPTFPVIIRRRNALVPPVEECDSAEIARSSSRFARSPTADSGDDDDDDDDYISTQQQNAALASLTPEQWIGIISGSGAASGASWMNDLNVGQSNANNDNDDGTSDTSSSDSSSDEDGDQMVRELHGLSYPSDDISEDDDSEENSDDEDTDDDDDDDDDTDGYQDSDDNLCTCITCIESRLNQSTDDDSDY
ncbi:hypothetical protein MP228_010024 [Amoeboaphelidium protococcarum]|nr:hypothetical protein MP228_010024 [Amoeboaphelidium protococcarum]